MRFKHQLMVYWVGVVSVLFSQVTPNVNSGNPNFPFPQFKAYTGGVTTLANKNPVGMPHAELEQRTKDAYRMVCNNMTYNVNRGGTSAPLTVAGVKYIMPNTSVPNSRCTCVEGDGYYLLAAAYMGDKTTFDGYFMWMHDRQFQKTQRFIDGVVNSPGYDYSAGISGAGSFGPSTDVLGGALDGNSAGDGDVDVALALLLAWKQWGTLSGITPPAPYTGGQISYRDEAIKYIRTMVDTATYAPSLPVKKYYSGDIGFDGYMKGGDTWNEVSTWAQSGQPGYTVLPERTGGDANYVDYLAPAYFRSFADMLQAEGQPNWDIQQYRRAEASSDWVMGQAYAQGFIPWMSMYQVTGTAVTFTQGNEGGEGFRYGWRTILNYVWHGAPTTTWNPTTHSYGVGSNTYNLDMAKRFATFLRYPENAPYNNACFNAAASVPGLSIGGPANIRWSYDMNGTNGGSFNLPMPYGPGSPSAVASGDWDLMSQMFRQSVINFDDQGGNGAQRYLTATPQYFHEWFRLLSMLVLAGNLHDPMQIQAGVNMKVYKSVNKTYAYVGDTITYTVSYRNYGKNDATAVVIKDTLDPGYTYMAGSSNKAVTASGNILTWTIGAVKGMNTGDVTKTQDSLKFKVIVNANAPARICNTSTISEGGTFHWKSNEYPNRVTEVMERNCVDILGLKPLKLTKTVDKASANPGDVLTYTVKVKNYPIPFLNGGRQGVYVSGAHDGVTASQTSLVLKYRVTHGAHEPLINYKNYRVSYFVNQTPIPTWGINTTINEGSTTSPTLSQQVLPVGATWNHRFIVTFPDQRATTTYKLTDNRGDLSKIHEGASAPLRLVNQINAGWVNFNALDDWSAETGIVAGDGAAYFPVANNWTDPLLPNQPVNKIHPDQCGTISTSIKKQLVEEWDGYTWRRIYGDAPVSGRELNNIVVKDYLPPEVSFKAWVSGPTGTVSGSTITWPTITQLLTGDSVVYKFTVTVKACSTFSSTSDLINIAEAKATNEPVARDTAVTSTGCGVTPISLVDFKGMIRNTADAWLTWTMANGAANESFEVQKSKDGLHYEKIGTVKGKNQGGLTDYSFWDYGLTKGHTYYRLVWYDEGQQTSKNIALSLSSDDQVLVYPNPFAEVVHVKIAGSEGEEVRVSLIDLTGKVLYAASHFTGEDISIGVGLPVGVYILQIEKDGTPIYVKIGKE